MDKIAAFGDRWGGLAKVLGTVVTILIFLGVGSFIYNEVWQKKSLTYTILPSYDLEEQAFSGLVIENRGRVPLNDVQIIITDLQAPIQVLRMPGIHEPANIVAGGEGQNQVRIELPRFSKEGSLSIYLVTSSMVGIEPGHNFLATSAETVAKSSTKLENSSAAIPIFGLLAGVLTGLIMVANPPWVTRKKDRLKQSQKESTHQESSNPPPSP